jgi:hypothetical protein
VHDVFEVVDHGDAHSGRERMFRARLGRRHRSHARYQVGFGMIPTSVGGAATMACTNGTSQPAGQTAPSTAEVLIGADFLNVFAVTSDCRCAKTAGAMVPSATSQVSGTISGMLVWTVPTVGAGYMYFAPKTNAALPITNTVAGM